MNGQRRKKHRTLTRAARVLAAAGVILSLFSIQQVWAEAFCACDHQNLSSSASEHCSKHAAQHEQCEAAHSVATHELAAQTEHSEKADSVATHQNAAQHEHGQESHSAAIQEHAEPSSHRASPDSEPSGSSATAQLERATSTSEGDGSGAPAKLICCHILPTAKLPASSVAVYSANASPDPTPVVIEIGAAGAVVTPTVLHPPRARPIYLAISSFLI